MVEQESFVVSGDEQLNAHIGLLVRSIVERVLEITKPKSIILYGSFARGEGTVYKGDDDFKIFSDVEIGIVSRNVVRLPAIRRLNRDLRAEGTDVTLSFFLPRRFTTLVASNWALPSASLTLEQYELMTGLRVLYGTDPRPNGTALSPSSIMRWDALRLLFNRAAELLDSLIEEPIVRDELLKASNKLLIACGDAALLLTNGYHYSYLERRQRLQAIIGEAALEDWPWGVNWECVLKAYEWKLNPSHETEAIVPLRTVTSEALIPVLRFCTEKIFGWSFQEVRKFREQYLGSPALKNCSRSFAGHPFLQNLLLAIKQILYYRDLDVNTSLWKVVHETYADLICTVVSVCANHSLSGQSVDGLVSTLTGEAKTRSKSLLSKWHHLCCVL